MPIDRFFRFYGITRKLVVIVLYVGVLIICTAAFIGKVHASNVCKVEVARIVSIQGTIEVRRAQQRQQIWHPVTLDTVLCLGDMIRSRTHSRATLSLANESFLNLNQKSSMTFLPANEEKKSFLMQLLEGAIHIITRTPKPFDVTTPFVNASVHGTEFLVEAVEKNSRVVVYEGKVTVTNDYGSVVLNDREAATAGQYQAPQKIIHIHPTDAVQWSLYYPTLATYWPHEDVDASGITALIQQASDTLIVGQADEAKSIIAQVLQREPNNSDAHALLAIIAVTQNDKDAANDFANQAVTFNPQSAVAYIALSYTQQAQFEIEEALASIRKSLLIDAHNALAWVRLAELQMSLGKLEQALISAQQAVQLNPNLAKTQTVLGFAHLLQMDTQMAKHTFNQSIALDSADPMPRLGLGLALIREGQLKIGRIQLETAVSLDPANSLIRSYLGKAYFEEKRYPLASMQFDLAKERDPKDPTPWLYDAIQKQTQNRPIEALQDIQKSMVLNDNRAVYRSKFLLDRDEAARGSSLSRIFETLGFERRAVMETAKSLSIDPANHSAHRFLSDTYANTPRHEIARVSELLQAQLLQPINVNPVQPHMAVADLNIITGTTPSAVSFNEFAPLMERNKPQMVASGLVGGNGTLGNEVVASMQRDRASVSLGQFHYETNGFRRNNDQNLNIYNGFFQYAVTPRLNIQTEIRKLENEYGYLLFDFNREKDNETIRNKIKEDSVRLGVHYKLSPSQDLLFSGKYIDRTQTAGVKDYKDQLKLGNLGYQLEAQHLLRSNKFNSTVGGGFYQLSWDFKFLGKPSSDNSLTDMDRKNLYAYTHTNFSNNLTATMGLSFDSFTSTYVDNFRTNKLNPKFGLQWNIAELFRLRAAWFETTKSHLVAQQTLEPTQVAGFNQFFDDPDGTRSTRMGIGLDSIFSQKVFAGVELSRRDLEVPAPLGPPPLLLTLQQQKESLVRAYIYWLPHNNWAVKSDPQLQIYSRDRHQSSVVQTEPVHIKNLLIPLQLEYFNTLGIFSSFTTTFIAQDLTRGSDFSGNVRTRGTKDSGYDSFFMLDASLGYRFPNRRGLLSFDARNLLGINDFSYRNFIFNESNLLAGVHSGLNSPTRFAYDRVFYMSLTLNF